MIFAWVPKADRTHCIDSLPVHTSRPALALWQRHPDWASWSAATYAFGEETEWD